jgi:hypothetical protein
MCIGTATATDACGVPTVSSSDGMLQVMVAHVLKQEHGLQEIFVVIHPTASRTVTG